MSESLADATLSSHAVPSFPLDGELPRLGGNVAVPPVSFEPMPTPPAASALLAAPAATTTTTHMTAPTVPAPASPPRPTGPSPMLSAPGSAPVLGSAELPTLPSLLTVGSVAQPTTISPARPVAPAPALPTLPSAASADHSATDSLTPDARGEHPMAHLMPQRAAPSEASKRAAETRAAKKAKARKIKIGVAIGALVFAALVGPPLGRWFMNALDDAGSTSTEVEG